MLSVCSAGMLVTGGVTACLAKCNSIVAVEHTGGQHKVLGVLAAQTGDSAGLCVSSQKQRWFVEG